MKKILPALFLFIIAGASKVNAQIVNNEFQNWYIDTFSIDSGQYGSLPADTMIFNEPVGWTTSNYLTDDDSLGSHIFVTQSSNGYVGNSAIQLVTDSVHVPPGLIHTSIPFTTLYIPGFAISGVFQLNSTAIEGSSGVINPGKITGAGQPFTQRLASINGYYNYTPVFNPNTGAHDTCIVWAVLRSGSTIVANAIFKSNDSTGGYLPFSANFDYVSCATPDTLVLFLASSSPNVYDFIPGLESTALIVGSKLLVGEVGYDTLAADYVFPPFVTSYGYTIYANTTDTFNVLLNDTDCGSPLTISIGTGPQHGTASVLADNSISYTPTANYNGFDYIYYVATNNSSDTAGGLLTIYVTQNTTGIKQVNQLSLNLHPVPAGNELYVQFQNPGNCTGKVYDVVGNVVLSTQLNNNTNQVNTQNLQNGIYVIEILNEQNAVIGTSRFVVAR